MEERPATLINRRQALISISTITAGVLLKPTLAFTETPPRSAVRFAVVGDWGTGERDQFNTAARMLAIHERDPLDFILTTGDNIYPNGSSKHFVKKFEEPFAGLIKQRVPFYTVLGNHDVESGRQSQCRYPLFNMGGESFYSIRRGNGLIDFFMLDSTDLSTTQVTWLETNLRSSRAQWKVAVMHHPIYSSGKKHGSEEQLRSRLEPLFTSYGVKTVFAGHDHVYERTVPQKGIQYFVTGAGGKVRRGDIDMSSPNRAASYDADNSFMVIDVNDNTLEFSSISEHGDVVDTGVIKQI
jgi:predicted MPP superfamily phosphohydrolase